MDAALLAEADPATTATAATTAGSGNSIGDIAFMLVIAGVSVPSVSPECLLGSRSAPMGHSRAWAPVMTSSGVAVRATLVPS